MAVDFTNFSNVTDKNWILRVLGNAISTSFSINWDILDNPFILSSTQWDKINPLIRDDFSSSLINRKNIVYADNPKIKSHKFFLLDGIKLIEYIDRDSTWVVEWEQPLDEDTLKEAIFYLAKSKILSDLQITILRELSKQFYIFKDGSLVLREQEQQALFNADDPEHEKIRAILDLPFEIYFNAIQNFPKELVDDVVMAEEHKFFKNDRLPVKIIPQLVRETMVNDDGWTIQLSYWQMYKAYHSLRKRFVWNACPRQSWKTFDAVRDCYQRLLSKDYYRIIYICETEAAFEQPRNYFESLLKKAADYGIIELNKSSFTIRCPFGWSTGNTLTFVSSFSKLGPRSLKGNYFVFDEGGKIKTSTWLDAFPIINNNNAGVLVNSTIFREMKKLDSERFYNELLAIEMWFKQDEDGTDDWMALRVNIDQIEWLSAKQKKTTKDTLRPYPNRFYCELYSQLPKADSTVVPEGFFIMSDEDKIQKDEFLLLGWDLAKRVDTAGMLLFSQKDWVTFQEQRLRGYTYTQQINIVKELKQMYPSLKVCADISNEEQVVENNPWLIDYPIKFTSATSWFKKEFREWVTIYSVGKEVLVNNFVNMAEEGQIRALSKLEMFRMEAENYIGKRNGRGWMSYEAQAGTDDLMSAMLCIAWIFKTTYLEPLRIWEQQREAEKRALENVERDDYGRAVKRNKHWYYWNIY